MKKGLPQVIKFRNLRQPLVKAYRLFCSEFCGGYTLKHIKLLQRKHYRYADHPIGNEVYRLIEQRVNDCVVGGEIHPDCAHAEID